MTTDIEIAGFCLKHHALLSHPSPPVSPTNESGIVWRVDFSNSFCPDDEIGGSCSGLWKAVVL